MRVYNDSNLSALWSSVHSLRREIGTGIPEKIHASEKELLSAVQEDLLRMETAHSFNTRQISYLLRRTSELETAVARLEKRTGEAEKAQHCES